MPRQSPKTRSQQGFTLIEVLIVVLIVGILAAISAPFLVSAKSSANEASAIGTMRALNSAQSSYSSSCGNGSYADSFDRLAVGRYASADMNLSPKSGFEFVLEPVGSAGANACDGEPPYPGYYGTATPLSETTGGRAFATNQQGAVWQDLTGVAPTEPFTTSDTVGPLEAH